MTLAFAAGLVAAPPACLADEPAPAGVADEADEAAALRARLTRGAMAKFRFAEQPRGAPAVGFDLPSGGTVALSSLRGKVVLVNVWASWCPPCREEMPSLARLVRLLATEAFAVVAVSIDKQPADAVRFLHSHGAASLPLYVDPGAKAAEALGASGVPVSILIDAEGREVGRLRGGADWMSDEAVLLIRAMLREGASR